MIKADLRKNYENLGYLAPAYAIGEHDIRPWGHFNVINAGERKGLEFCEKRIVVNAGKALSLQRHQGRQEMWYVLEGEINIILDGVLLRKGTGDQMEIPRNAIHTIVNLADRPALIYEKQEGICREGDNERIWDINGRDTNQVNLRDPLACESVRLYKSITALIR